MGKKCGDMAWPCDLALYALRTDVLVVLLDVQRLAAGKCVEAKVCEELQFDPLVEAVKKRVICIVMDSDHFELAVVRTLEMRFLFSLGSEWNSARLFDFRVHQAARSGSTSWAKVGASSRVSACSHVACATSSLSPSLERELHSIMAQFLLQASYSDHGCSVLRCVADESSRSKDGERGGCASNMRASADPTGGSHLGPRG